MRFTILFQLLANLIMVCFFHFCEEWLYKRFEKASSDAETFSAQFTGYPFVQFGWHMIDLCRRKGCSWSIYLWTNGNLTSVGKTQLVWVQTYCRQSSMHFINLRGDWSISWRYHTTSLIPSSPSTVWIRTRNNWLQFSINEVCKRKLSLSLNCLKNCFSCIILPYFLLCST